MAFDPNYFSGQGAVYAQVIDPTTNALGPMVWLGNVPKFELGVEVTKNEHKESYSGGRSVDIVQIQERKGTISMTMEDYSLERLSLGLYGQSVDITAASASETHWGYKGVAIPLERPKLAAIPNVVVKDLATGATTYVLDTDYSVDTSSGFPHILVLSGGAITDGEGLTITYDYDDYTRLEAFTKSQLTARLRFEGVNTLNNQKCLCHVWKANLDPLSTLPLINEEIGSMDMSGNVLYDSSRTEGSNFFEIIYL